MYMYMYVHGSKDVISSVAGCNCKRSGCLKNYCECYEVVIHYVGSDVHRMT